MKKFIVGCMMMIMMVITSVAPAMAMPAVSLNTVDTRRNVNILIGYRSKSSVNASYRKIYNTYTKKLKKKTPGLISEYKRKARRYRGNINKCASLCTKQVQKLAKIETQGTQKMAGLYTRGIGSYSTYEKWAGKLYDQYEKYSGKITDAYTDSFM